MQSPRILAAALTFLLVSPVVADTLVTDNYTIKIQVNCPEGNVTCDDVSYHGTSHKSGEQLSLKGKTISKTCADGVTPCQFLGYQFKNGNTIYKVLESGQLLVEQNGKTLVDESGAWSYQ
ncbi:hypothetical protein ACONUD_01185 [Microbulbifer harenosus]|uniref:hypothetical protein n=1 Tax=Microbulbifer harenosus TaxID=2576840 RepID=UPI0014854357|nr:hypothetical protein [Microbulbifer harenosus]